MVLAVLLLHANQVVPADRLIEALWGDGQPASAMAALRNHVLRLRQLLGDGDARLIRTQSSGYLIQVADGDLDLQVFSDLCASGDKALRAEDWERAACDLGGALALWRGTPMADVPALAGFEARVQQLEETRLLAYEGRFHAELRLGRHDAIAGELRDLAGENPFREVFHQQLMLSLYRSGRRAEALDCYQRLRRTLIDELGVEPSPPVQKLHLRILNADAELDLPTTTPASASVEVPNGSRAGLPVPAQLPRDVRDFTGRRASVTELCRLLQEGGADGPARPVVVSAVTGIGGVGKTTLALHVGHRLLGDYPDGQLYIDLRGTGDAPRDPIEVLVGFLRELGEPDKSIPQDAAACQARFRSVTAGRRLLIVLDDARDAAQVRPLLPGSGACAVLVTSRSRLPGLAGAVPLHLDALTPPEARELFASVVGDARVRAEPDAAEEVLGFCGGLPLAIRIAASRLASRPAWTIAALAERLADEHRRLDELRAEDMAVRATFQLSYASLQETDDPAGISPAQGFRLLGLMPGPDFAAPAVAVLFDQPLHRTEDLLGSFVTANLLEEPSPGRFRFHDLLRMFAAELAWAEEEASSRDAAVGRLLDWYVHTAAAADGCARPYRKTYTKVPDIPEVRGHPALAFDSYDQVMKWYDRERAGLVAAVALAERVGRHEVAWQLPYLLYGFFYLRNHMADLIATHESAIAASRKLGHTHAEALTWNRFGNAYHILNRLTDALGCYERSLVGMRTSRDRRGEADTLANLGMLNSELGRYNEALEYNGQSMELYLELGYLQGQGSNLNNRADTLRKVGCLPEAAETIAEALRFVRKHGFSDDEVPLLITSGEIHEALGLDREALEDFQTAAERARGVGNRRLEAIALDLAGRRLAASGRECEAADAWRQALAIMKETGNSAASDVAEQLRTIGC